MMEMIGGCCVCSDENGSSENPLVYCDGKGCGVGVHQACYGIEIVPPGSWYCRMCESQHKPSRIRCELCPSREGALKRTDMNGWAHVVCALYIPEIRFGDVRTMEPIFSSLVPAARLKRSCYICRESPTSLYKACVGACMKCNKYGCKQYFHVTCAQKLGLLCDVPGIAKNSVKYCGYCQNHSRKLKRTRYIKKIPPYQTVAKGVQSVVISGKRQDVSPDISQCSATSAKIRVSGKLSPSSAEEKNSTNVPESTVSRNVSSSTSSNTLTSTISAFEFEHNYSCRDDTSYEFSSNWHARNKEVATNAGLSHPYMKYWKADPFVTVKRNDSHTLAGSLDPSEYDITSKKCQYQSPQIKPNVTIHPIPILSRDSLQHKESNLIEQPLTTLKFVNPLLNNSLRNNLANLDDVSSDAPIPTLFAEDNVGEVAVAGDLGVSRLTAVSVNLDSLALPYTSLPHFQRQHSFNCTDSNGSTTTTTSVLPSVDDIGSSIELSTVRVENDLIQPQPLKRGRGRPPLKRPPGFIPDGKQAKRRRIQKSKSLGKDGSVKCSELNKVFSYRDGMPKLTISLFDGSSTDKFKKFPARGRPRKLKQEPDGSHMDGLKVIAKSTKLKDSTVPQFQSTTNKDSLKRLPSYILGNECNSAYSVNQQMIERGQNKVKKSNGRQTKCPLKNSSSISKTDANCSSLVLPLATSSTSAAILPDRDSNKVTKDTFNWLGFPLSSSITKDTPFNASVSSEETPVSHILERLLKSQWIPGFNFVMEEAEKYGVGKLLSDYHKLEQENEAMETYIKFLTMVKRKNELVSSIAQLSAFGNLSQREMIANHSEAGIADSSAPQLQSVTTTLCEAEVANLIVDL